MSGACASAHDWSGLRFNSDRRVRADRSFNCARGRPNSLRTSRASRILSATATFGRLAILAVHLLQNGVYSFRIRQTRLHLPTKLQYLPSRRVSHLAQVRGIHLGMPTEQAKTTIKQRRIQEDHQSSCQVGRQSSASRMEVVEMVFETDLWCANAGRVIDCAYHPPWLLLRGESFCENVITSGDEQVLRFSHRGDCVGLLRTRERPTHKSTVEVAWVDERCGPRLRVLTKECARTKINHPTRRHFQSEVGQRRAEL